MNKLAFAVAILWTMILPARAQNPVEIYRIKSACGGDAAALCAGVKPGGGRMLACLQGQQAKMSAPCRANLPEAKKLKDGAEATGKLPK
ncbi:cysteine rich repeat-containing protein [Rhodoblastus acidophilus]|uniref:Cysteine rich repeat-containing protein n=1 Tax=Candidatus Rhodoblastus alkanivorans TaxID=2954117 RepID=A0ABS9Z8E6_9HYPH|nr:cysteine rich repeat-containing protein [Candidatus Rhodoblastus alkanivorans]MCI4678003.1 cysteine rich repeat-containing protein [Candidatus Rhodoblastus alkanivorans]MCI4683898.1 cysteine rich repeat-containing protein [Candidatus Rhodoblastus alkanivorans]MDI4641216.1 cysteine rich repeat-containing protein [Rhodoblastus acidophilus]